MVLNSKGDDKQSYQGRNDPKWVNLTTTKETKMNLLHHLAGPSNYTIVDEYNSRGHLAGGVRAVGMPFIKNQKTKRNTSEDRYLNGYDALSK